MIKEDIEVVRCPRCRGRLSDSVDEHNGIFTNGELGCFGCGVAWQIKDSVAHLVHEPSVSRRDRFSRTLYDWAAPIHDAAVTYALPLLQLSSEAALRGSYIRQLDLDLLTRSATKGRFRMLEVGVGAGANIPLLKKGLPPNVSPEFWAVDLSEGMLDLCRLRHRTMRFEPIRYVLADAHVLPFADGVFDRVFHVGGIAGFHNPKAALAEMARVAKPDTPIVVVDEQLSKTACAWQRLVYGLFTIVAPNDGSPEQDLPVGAVSEAAKQISTFYYCLRFRMKRKPDNQEGPPPEGPKTRDETWIGGVRKPAKAAGRGTGRKTAAARKAGAGAKSKVSGNGNSPRPAAADSEARTTKSRTGRSGATPARGRRRSK